MGMVPGHCFANALYYAHWHEEEDLAGWRIIVGYASPAGAGALFDCACASASA